MLLRGPYHFLRAYNRGLAVEPLVVNTKILP